MTHRLIPLPPPDRRLRNAAWLVAGALALSCHVAFGAFAIARMQDDPDDDDLGAPGIEVSFELASAPTPPSELPPGPESEASMQSAPVPEQRMAKEVELPKETPVEAENPDRQVTIEQPRKPDKDEPEPQAKVANLSEAAQAQEATAAPTIANAPAAAKSATTDQGTGESRQRVRVTWQKELLAHLDRHKRYPAERSQMSAEILVMVELDRTGRVLSARVDKSSGDPAFDAAALGMVERASPVPPPPPLVADEGLRFRVPVNFRKSKH